MTKRHIVVEKAEAPPPPAKLPKRQSTYPFSDMKEINNTFFVAGVTANTMHSAIRRFRKNFPDVEFTLRTVEEEVKGEEGKGKQKGVRVWRTK